jgi:Fe-S cluster biogenesis protein NfuA
MAGGRLNLKEIAGGWMDLGFRMHAERTPNPDSIKWVLGRPIVEGSASAHFDSAPPSEVSPLAERLFAIDGVIGVFFASNFVTVTKRSEIEWTDIAAHVVDAIKACLADGGSALGPAYESRAPAEESEVVGRILRILEEEVRPAVAMDGGDIVFAGFRDGIVELYMHGSCSGCPSSTATLKHGIEARLRDEIPEVQGVVAL